METFNPPAARDDASSDGLGTAATDGAPIDLDVGKLIGSRVIIQGASGAGKSWVLRKLLELSHGQAQHLVLDVEDELYTLRERFDYVIAGGAGADVAATVDNAAEMATTLLRLGASAVVQLNDLDLADRRAFVGRFVGALMAAPRALWHPVVVAIDEAQLYAPQAAEVASSTAITALATQGRKRGFAAIFATQRLSMVSKDVLGQCPNRLMGRADQALDQRAAADVLGFTAKSAEGRGLLTLRPGQFWAVGPALAPAPVLIAVAAVATTHLQPGQAGVPTPPPPEALRAMLAELSAVAARPDAAAEAGRNVSTAGDAATAASLKAALAALTGQLRQVEAERDDALADLRSMRAAWGGVEYLAEKILGIARPALEAPESVPFIPGNIPAPTSGRQSSARSGEIRQELPRPNSDKLPSAAAALLAALVACHPAALTWGQIATLCKRKARGGHFNSCRKALVDGGFVAPRGDAVVATAAGLALSGGPPPAPLTNDDRRRMWLDALPGPADRMLACLSAGPPLAPADLADALGMAPRGGHWNTGMSTLRRNGLIVEADGRLRPAEDLR